MTTKTKAKKAKAGKVQVQAVVQAAGGGIEAAIGAAPAAPGNGHSYTGKKDREAKAKKAQPIMRRLPAVTVVFDFLKHGKIERRERVFEDANEAKRFFLAKDIAEKNPTVKSANEPTEQTTQGVAEKKLRRITAGTWTTVCVGAEKKTFDTLLEAQKFFDEQNAKDWAGTKPEIMLRPATLAEAFPSDPVDPNNKSKLGATGDPTTTTVKTNGKPPATEAEIKAEAKKHAKQLKRKQKKGELIWKQADTKTVVAAIWQKPQGAFYDRWLIKYNDGTEVFTSALSVVHSRDNADHHLRVGGEAAIDGLSNKQYEEVLRRGAEYAQRQANRYKAGLTNFRASEPVQKEMDKRISKKALKQEAKFTPLEIELAKKLAETANFYCVSPSAFFADDAKHSKNPHVAKVAQNADSLLAKAEIDPLACTIRIVQYAKHLHNRTTPRLEVGGPQIGTPELAKKAQADAEAKTKTAKVVTITDDEGKTTTKVVKSASGGEDVDAFGNRRTSGKGQINAEILKQAPGTVFTVEMIDKIDAKTISTKSRTRRHFKKLAAKGFLEVTKKGYRLPEVAGTGKAKPEAPAKAKSEPKAAPKAAKGKGAKKAPAKAAGKATAGKGKGRKPAKHS